MSGERTYYVENAALAPMDVVRAYVELKRERKRMKARDADLVKQETRLAALIEQHMNDGNLPGKLHELGATVFTKNEIWPRVKAGVSEHQAREVFEKYGLGYMFSTKPNAQSLRGFINQHLDDDESKTARERISTDDVPAELLAILDIEDNYKVAVNGL